MRGEYSPFAAALALTEELPPRARRILQKIGTVTVGGGTTSACAENTQIMPVAQIEKWNYLRVRGEYGPGAVWGPVAQELPPRARRIP